MKKILKFMKNSKLRNLSILVLLLFIYIFICAHNYACAVSNNLSEAVFRLHVIANSDSDEDQMLKLKVRDSLISYMNDICLNCSTKEEAVTLVNNHLKDFQNVAEKTIIENGYNYSVKINIGNFHFPTKNYGDISLPAGFYDALRVEIGNAKGKNWWCVMFPSLCFIDISSGILNDEAKENLEENLEHESYSLISNQNNSEIKLKFKLIEFFSEKGLLTANSNI